MASEHEAQPPRNSRVKARETEIARRLLLVLERLPVRAFQNFVQNLREAIHELSEETRATSNSRWVSHAPPSGAIEIARDSFARVEVVPDQSGTVDRLDLVIPTPPVIVGGILVTSIVFEFKLGPYEPVQLARYAASLQNSLVLSVSKEANGLDKVFQIEGNTPIVFQTWEHVFFAFAAMLSGDAIPRVPHLDEPPDLMLGFDHHVAGQDRVAFEIESFLELLSNRDLLPNRELILAVPRGEWASDTLQADPPYYRHPDSWRSGYRYLVTVYRNTIEAIYEVAHSVTTDPVDGAPPPAPDGFDATTWEQEIAAAPGSRVSVLRRLDRSDPILGHYIGRKYHKQGPKGRAAAFTQTHRYIDRPKDLAQFFRVQKVV